MATHPAHNIPEKTPEQLYREEWAREFRDGIDRSTLEKPLATADTPLEDIDVSRPELYALDRWQPVFEKLRREDPVHYCKDSVYGAFWSVTTYKPLVEVESLPDIYSSDWRNGGFTILDSSDDETMALPMFIGMDRPEHTAQRRTVSPAFTPSEISRLDENVRARTAELLDSLPIGEEFDWVDKVSIELTTGMLAILFGFPWEDRRKLTYWSDWMGDVVAAMDPELGPKRAEAMWEAAAYFQALWKQRKESDPGPDLLSMMAHSEALGDMDERNFLGNITLLIVGGNDTTRNSMSGAVYFMNQFPEQARKLEENPDLIKNAVSETIRKQTPLSHMRRTAMQDTELDGKKIKKGDRMILWYISANRDESVFENANDWIVDRENARRQVAFGYGIHRCVGARLAELQLQVLFEEMAKRRLRPTITGEIERVNSNFVHGFKKMPVTLSKY
ncbi:cytochrome P450 [Parasphingopyxis lamellibrachiae]|uniref:Cytochrome P450 n=1 Tax=Parasphingopyxis lamellibrachiae TaxID=680125 RepID=A0A3D9FFL1_9SPHN|nr:cytochrome P450 [Parasphingopyxis lamellibrachiae]RED16614.1 cytochrome P450 [Parasphingopyxis lamellibrachiae]